jgi:hypothetical protein
MQNGIKLLLPLLATTALAACGDGTGSNDADVRVTMSRSTAGAAVMAGAQLDGDAAADVVPLSSLDSLIISISSVEALPPADTLAADSAAEGKGGWISIPVQRTLNLMLLPTDTTGGIDLARGELKAGNYRRVRLVVSDGSVFFKSATTVGGTTYPAGQRVALTVPSGKIRTSANFTVGADSLSTIRLVFDPAATVRNVTATGSGRVNMNPVLRVKAGK